MDMFKVNQNTRPEFPLNNLPKVLAGAVEVIADGVQVPVEIAGSSILATASLVTQGKANIKIDSRIIPLSLFFLTIAGSSDRKSTTDTLAMKPVSHWQLLQIKDYNEQMEQYKNICLWYEHQKSSILKSKNDDLTKIGEKMQILENDRPQKPIWPKMLISDATIEGLQKGFIDAIPTQGLFSDEAGGFFGGYSMGKEHAMKTISLLSSLWDGKPIDRSRAGNDESVFLVNRRLACHLMIQPIIAEKVMTDELLLNQGFLPRFLMTYPQSIAGLRLYREMNIDTDIRYQDYCNTLTSLLDEPLKLDDAGGLDIPILELDRDAKQLWINAFNQIESRQWQNNDLSHIKPTAGKMAEQILRMAGVFAVIEKTNKVTAKQMRGAIDAGYYFLDYFLWIIEQAQEDKTERQAHDLWQWIKVNLDNNKITATKIIQQAPRSTGGRSAKTRDRLMMKIVSAGFMAVSNAGKGGIPCEWVKI